jgi:hypothetical protein
VKDWDKWVSSTTSITGETLGYMNIKHYKYNWWNIDIHEYQFDIHVYECFTSHSCSVWYSCIAKFHQLYWWCWILIYINISPVILAMFDIHETLIYMKIKHYKYNWWNIDIHKYQTLPVYLVKPWYTGISNTTSITVETLIYRNIKYYRSPVILVVFDIHVYQCFASYSCSVWYSCISVSHQLYWQCLIFMYINVSPVITTSITGETLIYMNIKHYKYNWWDIEIQEYQILQA